MTASINTSSNWMPDKRWLDAQQQGVLDELLRWLYRDFEESNNHWVRGFAGSGKTILLVYALHQTMKHISDEASDKRVCFITYTYALRDLVLSAFVKTDKDRIPIYTFDEFQKLPSDNNKFDFVFVDEAQDIQQKHLKPLKTRAKNIVIAGDPHQSIYSNTVSVDQTANELSIPEGRQYDLSILYRLPKPVVEFADKIIPDTDMISAENGRRGGDGKFVVRRCTSPEAEARIVFETARDLARPKAPSVIILPNHDDVMPFIENVCALMEKPPPPKPYKKGLGRYSAFNEALEKSHVPISFFGSNNGALVTADNKPHIFMMTYHSAKGLDFKNVFLPSLNADKVFWRDDEDTNRALFFVGITRTSENLYLSFTSDKPHRYVEKNYPAEDIVNVAGDPVVRDGNPSPTEGDDLDDEDPF